MTCRTHIRWMIRRDLAEILAIEAASFDRPWSEDDFLGHLRGRNTIGMVAEHGERVVGFMIYELNRSGIDILNLATHPEFRRQGVGRQMAEKLVGKLSAHRRTWLGVVVRETAMDAHLFLRAMGFRAVGVLREHYGDTAEDGYRFVRMLSPAEAAVEASRDARCWGIE